MYVYVISEMLTYCKRFENNIWIKLGIAGCVCFLLCIVCFFVEGGYNDMLTEFESNKHQGSEKLTQHREPEMQDSSNQQHISLQFSGETSGNFAETTEFFTNDVYKIDSGNGNYGESTDISQITNKVQTDSPVLNNVFTTDVNSLSLDQKQQPSITEISEGVYIVHSNEGYFSNEYEIDIETPSSEYESEEIIYTNYDHVDAHNIHSDDIDLNIPLHNFFGKLTSLLTSITTPPSVSNMNYPTNFQKLFKIQ